MEKCYNFEIKVKTFFWHITTPYLTKILTLSFLTVSFG